MTLRISSQSELYLLGVVFILKREQAYLYSQEYRHEVEVLQALACPSGHGTDCTKCKDFFYFGM